MACNWLRRIMLSLVVAVMAVCYAGCRCVTAYQYQFSPPWLEEGWTLDKGFMLSSGLQFNYDLVVQYDCNLVLYHHRSWDQAVWSSGTAGRAGDCSLIMQHDCNAVLYETGTTNALWASGTAGGGGGCQFDVQEDGNLVIYNAAGAAVWASGTKQ